MRRLYDLTFIYFYDYTLFLCVHFGRTIVKNLYFSQYEREYRVCVNAHRTLFSIVVARESSVVLVYGCVGDRGANK